MKRIALFLLIFTLLVFLAFSYHFSIKPQMLPDSKTITGYEIVASDLLIPWDIAFLPDGDLLVTERQGQLTRIGKINKKISIDVIQAGEGGLLGIALHPDFQSNHWIYFYKTNEKDGNITNKVERYRYGNDHSLSEQTIIVDNIPGASIHNGGGLRFGPDKHLYITTGDAAQSKLAQDKNSLAGKILRVREDGSTPTDNPFQNKVYSYGHRNPQGITWDSSNKPWSTEHGPSVFESGYSGYDELNFIEPGKNYGWPTIVGDETSEGMITPKLHSGKDVWAPASALYYNGSVFFGGLKGEALYEAKILPNKIELKEHFKNAFGRIRAVVLGPNGDIFISTSNKDGRGWPKKGDDKIIKINPQSLK